MICTTDVAEFLNFPSFRVGCPHQPETVENLQVSYSLLEVFLSVLDLVGPLGMTGLSVVDVPRRESYRKITSRSGTMHARKAAIFFLCQEKRREEQKN